MENRKWKVLKSEYLSHEPWFTVRRDHVKLPNGGEIPDYYIFEYPEWINIIAITKNNQFVMIRQYRHGIGETAYELCAGVAEKYDTSLLESAKRELLEETGYGNGTWEEYMVLSANTGTHTNLAHTFLAIGVEPVTKQQLEATEDLTVHLMSENEVKKLLLNGEIKQALYAAPLWKYFAEKHIM